MTKPKIETAKHAGSCYVCGGRIYYGDKIKIVNDTTFTPPVVKACHAECYP